MPAFGTTITAVFSDVVTRQFPVEKPQEETVCWLPQYRYSTRKGEHMNPVEAITLMALLVAVVVAIKA